MEKSKLIRVIVLSCFLVLSLSYIITSIYRRLPQKESQIEPTVTVRCEDSSLVSLKGHALFDTDGAFKVNEKVYIEYSASTGKPCALRHSYDVIDGKGQMYAITKFSGRYPAQLIPGKVVAANY